MFQLNLGGRAASFRWTLPTIIALLASLAVGAGCGGSSASQRVDRPIVRNFSPFMSPIDFNTLQQNPTFTNAGLTVSTNPQHPGKILIDFQDGTEILADSVFLGGNPFLGPDPSALQITQEVPNVGNIQIPVDIEVQPTRLICTPLPPFSTADGAGGYITNMPDGQYTIGVFKNIKNTEDKNLVNGPVFHSFTVGLSDTIPPRVLTTAPVDGEQDVGAGIPPPAPPPGVVGVADISTSIFGPSTPDILVRFTEGVAADSVNGNNIQVIDAGAFVPGGGAPPPLIPAPGFPQLKSAFDSETLPSNGHELLFRVDPITGGFPFGTQIQVTVIGADPDANGDPTNQAPIRDLAGNLMENSFTFQFQTIAPPQLPQNPFPEFAIWWAASDRVGALDTVNQQGLADQFNGQIFPQGVPMNVIPQFTDTIATDSTISNFDPLEINLDTRTNAATCATWVYVQSPESGQVAILDSRTSIPIALLSTPSPGGIAVQSANQGAQVLLVTNSSANTFTAYNIGSVTPGLQFLNGPIFVNEVTPTGNTPRAISISLAPAPALITDHWNRDGPFNGPTTELIMYADFTDGVVNTTFLAADEPIKQFALGAGSAPNDISITPCFGVPVIIFASISQGGAPGEGKVAYYIGGPGCITGQSTPARPDSLVGDLTGFDGPAGLDDLFLPVNSAFWVVAESGTDAVSTLGFVTGTFNVPRVITQFNNVGDNPVKVAHRPAWLNPCIAPAGSGLCLHPNAPTCWYNGTEQDVLGFVLVDGTFSTSADMYVCARGAGQVTVLDQVTGARPFGAEGIIPIPGIRFVASTATQ